MTRTQHAIRPDNVIPAMPEGSLWKALSAMKKDGVTFHRYAALGPYVVDFLCPEHRLIVEIDAAPLTTAASKAYDRTRRKVLEANGYKVLRFWADHVESHLDGVLRIVRSQVGRSSSPSFFPKRQVTRRRGRITRTVLTH